MEKKIYIAGTNSYLAIGHACHSINVGYIIADLDAWTISHVTIINVGLGTFLRFCTGSSYLPPPGYRDRLITVKFDNLAPGVATSTCINDIVLPTTPEIVENEQMFAAMMEAVQSDNGKPFNCL